MVGWMGWLDGLGLGYEIIIYFSHTHTHIYIYISTTLTSDTNIHFIFFSGITVAPFLVVHLLPSHAGCIKTNDFQFINSILCIIVVGGVYYEVCDRIRGLAHIRLLVLVLVLLLCYWSLVLVVQFVYTKIVIHANTKFIN